MLLLLVLVLLEATGCQGGTPDGALLDSHAGQENPAPVMEGELTDSVEKSITEMSSLAELLQKARLRYLGKRRTSTSKDRVGARKSALPGRLPTWRRSIQSSRLDSIPQANSASAGVTTKDGDLSDKRVKTGELSDRSRKYQDAVTETSTTEIPTTTDWENVEDNLETTVTPIDIFDGQYHEVNPGQYHETNPGQYHEINPGQYKQRNEGQYHETNPGKYEAVVQFNENDETKSYNVHRKTGDYIIGEVGKIDVNNGQTFEGVRYTAVEGMVDQAQIAEILERYFGAGRR